MRDRLFWPQSKVTYSRKPMYTSGLHAHAHLLRTFPLATPCAARYHVDSETDMRDQTQGRDAMTTETTYTIYNEEHIDDLIHGAFRRGRLFTVENMPRGGRLSLELTAIFPDDEAGWKARGLLRASHDKRVFFLEPLDGTPELDSLAGPCNTEQWTVDLWLHPKYESWVTTAVRPGKPKTTHGDDHPRLDPHVLHASLV